MNYTQTIIDFNNNLGEITLNTPQDLTPIEKHRDIYLKREDLYQIHGAIGAKARTAFYLISDAKQKGYAGVTTAGSRSSPQINIVATISKAMGMLCVAHTPCGELSTELIDAQNNGATIIQHKAGYNNVIIARAREYAAQYNYFNIPFGMDCSEAVKETMNQVNNIPLDVKRIVIAVGSGMNLAGLLWGLQNINLSIPILGIIVGADPIKRLNKYAPSNWRNMVELEKSKLDYHDEENNNKLFGVVFDPIYEAKCLKYLQPNDLFWVIGIRKTLIFQ